MRLILIYSIELIEWSAVHWSLKSKYESEKCNIAENSMGQHDLALILQVKKILKNGGSYVAEQMYGRHNLITFW